MWCFVATIIALLTTKTMFCHFDEYVIKWVLSLLYVQFSPQYSLMNFMR